jgi:16S rRNA (cytosine1402-N4)-methyltransferase
MKEKHIPVMLNEVLTELHLQPGMTVIDATLGLGGHSAEILKLISPNGKLIGFDRDIRNLEVAADNLSNFKDRITLINSSFAEMSTHVNEKVDAILFDLGFSSVHVDEADRGFSFQHEGPLDMRYDQKTELTAEDIINGWSKEELSKLFRIYAEEPRAPQVAKAIFDARRRSRIISTTQLSDIICTVVPRRGKRHPATTIFQALRIAVNDEFSHIEKGILSAIDLLKSGGRLAVITFQSMEDRLVKQILNKNISLDRVHKKPLVPTRAEELSNPRARSAKLRIAIKK